MARACADPPATPRFFGSYKNTGPRLLIQLLRDLHAWTVGRFSVPLISTQFSGGRTPAVRVTIDLRHPTPAVHTTHTSQKQLPGEPRDVWMDATGQPGVAGPSRGGGAGDQETTESSSAGSSDTTPSSGEYTSDDQTASVRRYKRTRQEALDCTNIVPFYKLFDLKTARMKEKYLSRRSPSPPPYTTVYEVGTGRAFEYTPGTGMVKLHKDSVAFAEAKAWQRAANLRRRERKRLELSGPGTTAAARREETLPEERPPTGGLRRVVPLPVRAPQPPTLISAGTAPLPVAATDRCDCVTLVTMGSMVINTYRPRLEDMPPAEAALLLAESRTLRYLHRGYRNYVENDWSDAVHKLTAYRCRSTQTKLFSAYKTITTSRPEVFGTVSSSAVRVCQQPRSMAAVNEYFCMFTFLVDFNYTWLLPAVKGGLCNVVVVDKRWTFSTLRRVYLPHYRLLGGDGYTDLFVREMCKINNNGTHVRNVRFLSTADTVLYTNRRALLFNREGADEATGRPDAGAGRPTAVPPKKRRFNTGHDERSTSESTTATVAAGGRDRQPTPSTSTGGETAATYLQDMAPESSTSADWGEAINPTLVVFRHLVLASQPDTVLCDIMVEVNLTEKIQY